MSPVKLNLLKKLQHLEHKWSSELMTNGSCTVEMLRTENDIKSVRNQIKYQDIEESLQATA